LAPTLPVVAKSRSPVLLRGESGTGKELFARAIHDLSPCANGPFIKRKPWRWSLNTRGVATNLLERKLSIPDSRGGRGRTD
jgi:transcriptional regulator with PAS, ATPase and Fis domain